MKFSTNTIGMFIFAGLATAVFVLMVMRPAVEGSAINLGVPLKTEMAAAETSTEEATSESTVSEESVEKTEENES